MGQVFKSTISKNAIKLLSNVQNCKICKFYSPVIYANRIPVAPRVVIFCLGIFVVVFFASIVPCVDKAISPVSFVQKFFMSSIVHVYDLCHLVPSTEWVALYLLREASFLTPSTASSTLPRMSEMWLSTCDSEKA